MLSGKLSMLSTATLRAWLSVADLLPEWLPGLVDLRIAVRSELWAREVDAEEPEAWPVTPPEGMQ